MIRFGLRNAHEYGRETYEAKRLRLRSNAEDPRPGIDLTDDRADDFDPATDAWPNTLRSPVPALAGSCSTDAAPNPNPAHGVDAADTSAAGGPGGTCSPAAHPTSTRDAA